MTVFNLVASLLLLAAPNFASQIRSFLSDPGQQSVRLKVLVNNNTAAQAAGLIFLTPYILGSTFYGPTIYKPDGDVVWSGGYIATSDTNDFHPIQYEGQPGNYFIINEGTGFGHTIGVNRIYNGSYVQIGPDHGALNGLVGPDDHENNVYAGANGNRMIQSVYSTVQRDLTAYGGPKQGYIYSGCFQDFSLLTNNVTFQWCSGDHVALDETYVYLSTSSNYSNNLAGDGSISAPWDYFHINAIDKDTDGNYLVSSRHCSALYKVAGNRHSKPGSIIWRLGGHLNDFAMHPPSFNFSAQHDGRWQSPPSATRTLISLLDNGSDNFGTGLNSAAASSGMLASINETAMTATLLKQYVQPDYLSAGSQGSMSLLPNGNVFIGWGSLPHVSEFTAAGELLYYAKLGGDGFESFDSYRGFKAPWTGTPISSPGSFAYARTCNSTTYLYASFNGDTRTAYWLAQTANSPSGPWTQRGGRFKKRSFETVMAYNSTTFHPYARALAYNVNGTLLATSSVATVFVPQGQYLGECGKKHCRSYFGYYGDENMASSCGSD